MITFLKYVVHGELLVHLAGGWAISDDLHGTNHGNYAVLMVWMGEGEPNSARRLQANPANA
jgi:hypothetical protein